MCGGSTAATATALTLTSAIPSSIGTAWVSDSELVFAPAEGGLRLMNSRFRRMRRPSC